MDEIQEIIDFDDKLPLRILTNRLGDVAKHWHGCTEILWVLDGEVEVTVNGVYHLLKEDDILLINPDEIHETHAKGGVLLAIQIEVAKFGIDTSDKVFFDYDSSAYENKVKFNHSKHLLATLVKNVKSTSHSAILKCRSLVYEFFSEMLAYFRSDVQEVTIRSRKYITRLQSILNYVNDHYKEVLTASQVAESEHLSVPYFSSFFEKYMGLNFSTYYTDFRLEKAVVELLTSDDSIETIALNNGFAEVHSFVRAFKKKYDTLPSLYRKERSAPEKKPQKGINYTELKAQNYLSKIAKYLDLTTESIIERTENALALPAVDCTKKGTPLKKTFTKFIGVGRARELLYSDVQQMLIKAHNEIGYEFVKFHGILSDDMLLCKRVNGELKFSFVMVDKVLDFLVSIGMKPLVQLSFMPKDIADDPNKTLFDAPFIMSKPKDLNEWILLVRTFVEHLQMRYGKAQTENWLYCVWNEPDTSPDMFNVGDDEAFTELYFATYRTLKKIDDRLKVGTPSFLMSISTGKKWATKFVVNCIKNGCTPDFINMHYYADDFERELKNSKMVMTTPTNRLTEDEKHFEKCIHSVRALANDLGLENTPIYLTEWNLTLSHRNLINDTCFKACYLYKNLVDNVDYLDSFGYWSLTDFLEENQPSNELFHGGLGLFTQNGIPKANYYAFRFMNALQGNIIARGENYLVCKDGDRIAIATYNYEHFNSLFANGEYFDMTPSNRYTPFTKQKKLEINLPFISIENGTYDVSEYVVNRLHGSAFDTWVESGAEPLLPEQEDLLRNLSVPRFYHFTETITNEEFSYNATLEPLEIRLVIIKKRI